MNWMQEPWYTQFVLYAQVEIQTWYCSCCIIQLGVKALMQKLSSSAFRRNPIETTFPSWTGGSVRVASTRMGWVTSRSIRRVGRRLLLVIALIFEGCLTLVVRRFLDVEDQRIYQLVGRLFRLELGIVHPVDLEDPVSGLDIRLFRGDRFDCRRTTGLRFGSRTVGVRDGYCWGTKFSTAQCL